MHYLVEGGIELKLNTCKRSIFIYLIAILTVFIIFVKMYSSITFYKKAFNNTIYLHLDWVYRYSQSVCYSIDELTSNKSISDENLNELWWNYAEMLRHIQSLNSVAKRFSQKYVVNLDSYPDIGRPIDDLKTKYSDQSEKINLTNEEINKLIGTKKIFQNISDIVRVNINSIHDTNAWGDIEVVRNGVWLDTMKDIQDNLNKLCK